MTTLTEAAALHTAFLAAHDKLHRNAQRAAFISMHKGMEDPFLVYADKFARWERLRAEALAAWNTVAKTLTTAEVVASVSGEMGMGVSSPKSFAEGRGDNAEWLTPPFFSNGPGRPAKRGVPSVVAF